MRIVLDLKRHCIETEIKRLYDQAVFKYFRAGTDRSCVEEKIESLRQAMDKLDFGRMRSRHPALAGHSDAEVVLLSDDRGRLMIEFNQQLIDIDE